MLASSRRKGKGRNHGEGLGGDEKGSLAHSVRHNASDKGEEEYRQRCCGGNNAKIKGGLGERIYKPSLGSGLHPCPGEGD